MDWELKTEMIKLGNVRDQNKEDFQNFVLEHASEFDGQAWDMFSNLVDIIPNEMKEDIDFWKELYPHLKDVDPNNENFGFRSGMRIAMIQTVCEEELNYSS